jgi:hypothetical protein
MAEVPDTEPVTNLLLFPVLVAIIVLIAVSGTSQRD